MSKINIKPSNDPLKGSVPSPSPTKKSDLSLKPINLHTYEVVYENRKTLCEFVMDVDGFYYARGLNSGYWTEHNLLLVANELTRINRPWNEKIRKEFDKKMKNEPEIFKGF